MSKGDGRKRLVTWMPRLLIVAIVAAVGGFFALTSTTLQNRIVQAAMIDQLGTDRSGLYTKDALRAVFCGTAAPPPSPGRAKSCTLVTAGNYAFIVDSGPKSTENLVRWRIPLQRTTAVLITHFHSDHIGELGELALNAWISGRKSPLPVWGPDGIESVVGGFNEAYALDTAVRREHHGTILANGGGLVAVPFGLADAVDRAGHQGTRVIFNRDGLKITAFQVIHEPVYPAVGYHFDYRGRSIVITGDAIVSPNLTLQARGADALISESQSEPMRSMMEQSAKAAGQPRVAQLMRDIKTYHLTPVDAARLADKAGVDTLVFTHFGPNAPTNWLTQQIYMRGVERMRGDVRLANDGSLLTLPVGSKRVTWGAIE
jgi:ribonuclease Z